MSTTNLSPPFKGPSPQTVHDVKGICEGIRWKSRSKSKRSRWLKREPGSLPWAIGRPLPCMRSPKEGTCWPGPGERGGCQKSSTPDFSINYPLTGRANHTCWSWYALRVKRSSSPRDVTNSLWHRKWGGEHSQTATCYEDSGNPGMVWGA